MPIITALNIVNTSVTQTNLWLRMIKTIQEDSHLIKLSNREDTYDLEQKKNH